MILSVVIEVNTEHPEPEECGRLQMTQKKSKAVSFFFRSGSTKKEGVSNMTG
jgi:hypothetical protein